MSIPAFAADITVAPTETVTNEYQSMLELQKISNATLAAEGYTPSEIETIRNTDQIFDDHIALLNTLSDNSLQTAGYTVDQIRGIRNYDPDSATVNEKVALSAECVTTSTIESAKIIAKERIADKNFFMVKPPLILGLKIAVAQFPGPLESPLSSTY